MIARTRNLARHYYIKRASYDLITFVAVAPVFRQPWLMAWMPHSSPPFFIGSSLPISPDFDPWEISKDGLEELIQNQNQAESEISSSSDVPSTTTTLSQPSTTCPPPNFNSHFQVGFQSFVLYFSIDNSSVSPIQDDFVSVLCKSLVGINLHTFQVQNNFINHIQPKPEPFMFQSFQQTQQQQPFSPFNLSG